ncbi:pyrin-like [Stegastes partitus]|uniref:Pyrin-like n=1 Tax=Stegastes partitus TaxID=144197 RepID=A0A9Y4KFS2_9TELE|nr:PREDICTED: pyrin-like [Stegastes partitus]
MQVQQLLLEILEDLIDEELKMFQWYCTMDNLDECKRFPKTRLDKASRIVTVTKLTESYGEESAVRLTVEILKKMRNNSLADKLCNMYAEGRPAAPSTSSSAQSPPAAAAAAAAAAPAATISAQEGSVVIAPMISSSSTTGSLNITIHKP